MRSRLLLALPLLLACGRTLDLPSVPAGAPPVVTGIDPPHAVAGARLTVSGSSFRAPARVRFGPHVETQALSVADDGLRLTVEVPEDVDAREVTLTVVADGREGTRGQTFTFDGLDHLRYGRIAGTSDFRAPVLDAAPLPHDGSALLLDEPYDAVVDDAGDLLELPDARVVGIASSPAADRLLAVDNQQDVADCPNSPARLWVVDAPFTADETRVEVCLPTSADAFGSYRTVALDRSGQHAAVLARDEVAFVDLTKDPPVVRTAQNFGQGSWEEIAAVGDDRFVVAEGGTLALASGADASVSPPVTIAEDDVQALAAEPGGSFAAAVTGGTVQLFAPGWPPVKRATLDSHAPADFAGMAFAASGLLAATQVDPPRVVFFDANGETRYPVEATALEVPARLTASDDGVFRVAVLGGMALFSEQTGALLENRRLPAGLTGATGCAAQQGDQTTSTVVLAAHGLGGAFHLDPANLQLTDRTPIRAVGANAPVDALVSAPGGRTVFLRRGLVFSRTGDDSYTERADRFTLPAGSDYFSPLAVSADGRFVAFEVQVPNPAGGDAVPTAYLLDATASDWSTLAPPTFTFGDDKDTLHGAAFDAAGDLVLLAGSQVRIIARADALAGKNAGLDLKFDNDVSFVLAIPAGFFLLTNVGDAYLVKDGVRTSLGNVGDIPELPRFDGHYALTPRGRRLYWVTVSPDRASDDAIGLASWTFDLATGAVLGAEPPIPVPPGMRSIVALPDGEHLLAVDGKLDLVYRLE